MTRQDLQALRRVLRYVSTSDTTIQDEVLRLDTVLERALEHTPRPNHQGASRHA